MNSPNHNPFINHAEGDTPPAAQALPEQPLLGPSSPSRPTDPELIRQAALRAVFGTAEDDTLNRRIRGTLPDLNPTVLLRVTGRTTNRRNATRRSHR